MRKILLMGAMCVAAVGVSGTAAAQDVNPKYTAEEPKSAAEEMKAAGVVREADQQSARRH